MGSDLCYTCIHKDDGYCLIDESYDNDTPDYILRMGDLVECEKYKEDWVKMIKHNKGSIGGNKDILIPSMLDAMVHYKHIQQCLHRHYMNKNKKKGR